MRYSSCIYFQFQMLLQNVGTSDKPMCGKRAKCLTVNQESFFEQILDFFYVTFGRRRCCCRTTRKISIFKLLQSDLKFSPTHVNRAERHLVLPINITHLSVNTCIFQAMLRPTFYICPNFEPHSQLLSQDTLYAVCMYFFRPGGQE